MAAVRPPPASTLVPFLVLPENRFALEAISVMAEEPSRPVFLYGPSGAGKSHLVRHAVRLFLLQHPQARVEHLTAGDFAAEFAEASARGTIPLFQAAMREFDLFVLEDVQALEGRTETLVQLLSLCEELWALRSRQIWTSRCSPGDLSQFPRKLISRFRGGVTARLKLPGQASREKLLEHFAGLRQIGFAADAAQALAEGLAVSPRELWAALSQLEALARHERRPIDVALIKMFLQQEVAPQKPRLDDISRAVARQFGLTVGQLRSRKQARQFVLPRQCAMFLSRRLTAASLEQIGRYFGKRDHSTVIHACRRLAALIPREADLRLNLSQVETMIGGIPGEDW
jgi:chromosomal replication initiator protein